MKQICKRLTVLLLLLAMAVALIPGVENVHGVDLSRPCSLTVVPGAKGYKDDLAEAGVVIDLYKVADAREVSGGDMYSYQLLDAYKDLNISDSPDNSEWRSNSQKAADIALRSGRETPVVRGAASGAPITTANNGSRLSSGLYLVVARGQGVEQYITEIQDETGAMRLATVAYSQHSKYTFAPELVSLPGKEASADGSLNTANPGDWVYDMSITLKPEKDNRYGSLEIVKTLLSYETSAPATFVFSIEAEGYNEKNELVNVYSDVVTMVFTESGVQSVLIDKLPAGAVVTVTEVYSGACYVLTTDDRQISVISADTVASVSFTNGYNNSPNKGGGITNKFAFTDHWDNTPIPHDGDYNEGLDSE